MIVCYVTCKNKIEAKKISKHLLNKRMIACSNMFPVSSMYWWEKKIVYDKEVVLILKTTNKNFNKIKKEIEKIHSYEIQCILKINVEASKEYANWVRKEAR